MAQLPADRSKLALAQNNQNPLNVLSSSANKNALTEAYDTIDALYNYATGLVSASTLSRLGQINVKDYNASGLDTTFVGSIASGSKVLTLTTTPDFVAGQGINLQGVFEVASLSVTAGASSSANCTVTLNGVATTVALTSGDTATEVATAIRAATFAGWTTGGTGTTVTFTSTTSGTKTDATYSAGTTGATGTMTTTVQGTNDLITTVSAVNGLVVTIAAAATSTITGGTILHDDDVALNAAFTAAETNQTPVAIPFGTFIYNSLSVKSSLIGAGYGTKLVPRNSGSLINVTNSNITISGIRLEGTADGGIKISGGADNILIEKCYFKTLSQVVWLFDCTNITVQNCYYNNTGYGIIQQLGYVSSFVNVINNVAFNMVSDFVEANCASSAPSESWIISGNQYLGNALYPSSATEKRFVGITSVSNVTISNNFVKNSAGDGAIHLEDTLGQTIITGNHFENCVGSYAYLYLLNSAEDTIISNNWFIHSDVTLPAQYVMNLDSASYVNRLIFSNNHVIGNASYTFSGINFASQNNLLCVGNYFRQCDKALYLNSGQNGTFNSNVTEDCNYALKSADGTTSGSNNNWVVNGNRLLCNTNCIEIRRNTNGTGASSNWLVTNNYFSQNALAYDTADMNAFNNVSAAGKSINLGSSFYGGTVRYNWGLNTVVGTGLTARSAANADTSGATLAQLETTVNTLKAALRTFGVIAP